MAVVPAEGLKELEWFRFRHHTSQEKYLKLGVSQGQLLVGVED